MSVFPSFSASLLASQGAAAGAAGGGAAAGGTGLLAALGPVGLAVGVGTIGLGLLQTFQQNNAVRAAMEAEARAAAIQRAQIRDQTALERIKISRETSSQRARATTLLASRGVLGGVSALDILSQATADKGMNTSILESNARMAGAQASSRSSAQIASLRGSYQNPLLAGINSTFSGFQNALMVAQGMDALKKLGASNNGGTWAGTGGLI